MVETETFWHIQTAETVAGLLKTDLAGGLSATEAKERLAAVGPNRLEDKARVSPLAIFAAQFNDFMIWVLIAAALISGFVLREQIDALAITAILILNALLGFRQEVKAEKALEALRKLAAPSAKVIRDGAERQLPAADLVPGDLIVIEAGDQIPADVRLVESNSLLVNESSLTGESKAVSKTVRPLSEVDLSIGDRINLAYMGTVAVAGRGRALVYATGDATQMGEISGLLQQPDEKTPLQIELHSVGKAVALLALAISGVVCAFGYGVRGFEPSHIFLTGVALAVAAIPEGLPAVVSVALALGVQAMAKRHVIIRKLHA
ncbi:MAG: HAD-IC family P-type ATPase, partial [Actinomycetota bacterium]|nr:HAD-IC family P-type ATPase [Actinomycetota bacterium]